VHHIVDTQPPAFFLNVVVVPIQGGMKTFAKECTTWADVQAVGLTGSLTCDRAGRQNGTHHRETQSALQTLVMEDDHQIAFNSQAIRVLLQHKDYDFIKQDGQWFILLCTSQRLTSCYSRRKNKPERVFGL
jgi:hypothetical protein